MSIFRPLATHAEGHLKVTTIVVVVIDIYLYYYYYLNGHSELPHGSRVRRNPVGQFGGAPPAGSADRNMRQSRECHDGQREGPEPGTPGTWDRMSFRSRHGRSREFV